MASPRNSAAQRQLAERVRNDAARDLNETVREHGYDAPGARAAAARLAAADHRIEKGTT